MNAKTQSCDQNQEHKEFLLHQCEKMAHEVLALWGKDEKELHAAKWELEIHLQNFLAELETHSLFSTMPPLNDDFEYLWAMFMLWGAPQTEVWTALGEDSHLSALTPKEFFLALAVAEIDYAVYYSSEDALTSGWTGPEANDMATTAVRAAQRALSFANSNSAPDGRCTNCKVTAPSGC